MSFIRSKLVSKVGTAADRVGVCLLDKGLQVAGSIAVIAQELLDPSQSLI